MADYHQHDDGYLYDYQQNDPDTGLYYDDEETYLQHLIQQEHERMASEFSVVNECIIPTLSQGFHSLWVLFVLCLALRCVSLLRINSKLLHIASAIAGFVVLWHFYEQLTTYVVLLAIIGYICMTTRYTRRGAFLSAVCTAYMLSW